VWHRCIPKRSTTPQRFTTAARRSWSIVATYFITIGGIAVVVAVLGILSLSCPKFSRYSMGLR
jgi:hypothetical protein